MNLTTWEQRVIKRSQKTKGRVLLRFACWFLWVLSLWTLVQSARAFVEFAQLVRSNELQWLQPFLTESSRIVEDSILVARVYSTWSSGGTKFGLAAVLLAAGALLRREWQYSELVRKFLEQSRGQPPEGYSGHL